MKATSYEDEERVSGADLRDSSTSVTDVTEPPKWRNKPPMLISRYFEHCDSRPGGITATSVTGTPTSVTRHQNGFVTVLLVVPEFYWKRLRMSKPKIRSVWLTVERVAELMNCSTRTVWRYVKRNQIQVHKQQLVQDGFKVMRTFLLTEPTIYLKEMADCQARQIAPDAFIELTLKVDGKDTHSALVYSYGEGGNKHGYL